MKLLLLFSLFYTFNSFATTSSNYEADESLLELPPVIETLTGDEIPAYEKRLADRLTAIELKLSTLGSEDFIHGFVLSNQRTRAFNQLMTAVGNLKSKVGLTLQKCINSMRARELGIDGDAIPNLTACSSIAKQYLEQLEPGQDPNLPLLIQGIITHTVNSFSSLQKYIRDLKPVRNAYQLELSKLLEVKASKALPSTNPVTTDVTAIASEDEAQLPSTKTPCFLISGLDQDYSGAFLKTRMRLFNQSKLHLNKLNTGDCVITKNWTEAISQFRKLSYKPAKVLFLQVAHGWMDGAAATNIYVNPEEIFQFLKELSNQGTKVGLVLDSCFSGTFIENFLAHPDPYKKTNVCVVSNSIPKRYSWSTYDIVQNIIDSSNLTGVFTKASNNSFSTGFGLDKLNYTSFLKSSIQKNGPKLTEARDFVMSMINSALGRNQQNPFALFLQSNAANSNPSQKYLPHGDNFLDIAEYFRGNYQTSMVLSEGLRGKDDGRYLNNATDVFEDALLFHLKKLKSGDTAGYSKDDLDRFSACENFSL